VRIGIVQSACSGDREANVAQAIAGIAEAAAGGAEVVCLQELFAGEYPCQSEDHEKFAAAEGVPGPLTARLAAAAKQHGVVLVGSVFERRTAGLFHNTAVVFDADGSTAGVYRKMHIPDDPHYYEKFYFAPGDTGFMSIPTSRLAREQYESWDTMLRSHAIANGVFVVAVNRSGREGSLRFWGASVVYAPNGQCLVKASHDVPETLVCECDLDRIEWSRMRWPFFRDRRIDAYGNLLQRWGG